MATDDQFAYLTNKKLIPYEVMQTYILDYLKTIAENVLSRMYEGDGVFEAQVSVTGSAIGEVSVPAAFEATDGHGHQFSFQAADSRLDDVPFENTPAVSYHFGLRQIELYDELDINPRTGQPEYRRQVENIGTKGTPDTVVDNGSNLTITVDSVTESGVSHAGRTVRVYLVTPQATTWAVACEDVTVSWSGTNNQITTTGLLGQEAGSVSTTAADYVVAEIGPVLVREATQDLKTADGVCFLAEFDGNAGSAPTPDMTDQQIMTGSLTDLAQINAATGKLTSSAIGAIVLEGLEYSSGGSDLVTLTSGKAWVPTGGDVIDGYISLGGSPSVAISDGTNYIYLTPGVYTLQSTQTKATAYTAGNLPLQVIVQSGGTVTSQQDISYRAGDINKRGVITVGEDGADSPGSNFKDLQAAFDYIDLLDDQDDGDWPGIELWINGQVSSDAPGGGAATIGSNTKGLTIRGANWRGSSGAKDAIIGGENTDDATLVVSGDSVRFVGLRFIHNGSDAAGGVIVNSTSSPATGNVQFNGCYFTATNGVDYLLGCPIGQTPFTAVCRDCTFDTSTYSAICINSPAGESLFDGCKIVESGTPYVVTFDDTTVADIKTVRFQNCDWSGATFCADDFTSVYDGPFVIACILDDSGPGGRFYDCIIQTISYGTSFKATNDCKLVVVGGTVESIERGQYSTGDLELNGVLFDDGGSFAGTYVWDIQGSGTFRIANCTLRTARASGGITAINLDATTKGKILGCDFESVSASSVSNAYLVVGDGDLKVSNCTFEGITNQGALASITTTGDVEFFGCTFGSVAASAVSGAYISATGGDLKIMGCAFDSVTNQGAVISYTPSGKAKIIGNDFVCTSFSQATYSFVVISLGASVATAVVSGNYFASVGDGTYGGIGVHTSAAKAVITDNHFYNVRGAGIYIDVGSYGICCGNTMDNVGDTLTNPLTATVQDMGIFVDDLANRWTVCNNVIYNVTAYGIEVSGDSNVVCSNVGSTTGTAGIRINSFAANTLVQLNHDDSTPLSDAGTNTRKGANTTDNNFT